MALRSDSYGSVAEVLAFTRHLLDGATTFNPSTRPTLIEVEKFIDRNSGVLNSALAQAGFATPLTNSTAALACAQWVVTHAATQAEYTGLGVGFSGEDGQRQISPSGLNRSAKEFVRDHALGWKQMGATVTNPSNQGLTFTALDKHGERSDPGDTSREQPVFRRRMFDNQD